MHAIRTILMPTDYSPPSEHAYRLACSLARDHGARLVLLHVRRPEVTFGELYPLPPRDPAEERLLLPECLGRLHHTEPAVPIEYLVKEGEPAEVILATARQVESDLIVMGAHGRSGVGRLLLGSVAEKVLRRAPCPVLTVKTPSEPRASGPGATAGRSPRTT
jgi:nucleotide-binding universal stress UspA family protein